MDKKIAEYWEQKTRAENIVEAFCKLYWTNKPILKAIVNCYTKKDLLLAAQTAEARNCEDYIVKELWMFYHKE